MNKVIGKPYIAQTGHYTYINEFGRDSLRIILEELKGHKFAIPDLCCPIIPELMDTLGIKYQYYRINEDRLIDMDTIHEHDVFYHINYTGKEILISEHKILLEDNVFLKDFKLYHSRHIAFNSWRKCTPLHCGSMIKSTIKLRESYFRMPADQIELLLNCEQTDYRYYMVNNRDELQQELAKQNIFLPVFWRDCNSELADKIIQIPVDDRYTEEDIRRVEEIIWKYQ